MDTSLAKRLAHSPVIATLYGAEQLGASVALYPALGGGWTEKVEP